MITPSKDLGTTKKAFEQLPSGDVSKEYFSGQVWNKPNSIIDKFIFNFGIESKLANLKNVYPHQAFINKVNEEFKE